MDSSGKTESRRDWEKMVAFVKKFVNLFDVRKQGVNVGIVIYSNRGQVVIPLNKYQDIKNLTKAINTRNLPFKDQMTNTADGLRVMRSQLFTERMGDRDFATNVGLLLTEGPSNKEKLHVISEAKQAREKDIIMFAVGITNFVDKDELNSIVGDKTDKFITYLDSMMELERSQTKIHSKLCQGTCITIVTTCMKESILFKINLNVVGYR